MNKVPQVFSFECPRDYIKAYDLWAQKNVKSYSRRAFASWAKIKSHNFLTTIISGAKPMHTGWVNGFSKAAKLSTLETKYLKILSQIKLSKNFSDQKKLYTELKKLTFENKLEKLRKAELYLLSDLKVWDLYHALGIHNHQNNWKFLKKKLRGKISISEIQDILKKLLQLKLINKDDTNSLRPAKEKIETEDQLSKLENFFFHKQVLKESLNALEELDPSDRSFGSLTLLSNRESLEEIKKEVRSFGLHLFSKYEKTEKDREELIRINIQLYPLTAENNNENTPI